MSGTSVDSLDAILVDFSTKPASILGTYSTPISSEIQSTVHSLALSGNHEIQQLRDLDQVIADISSQTVKRLCQQSKIERSSIKAIGSHGQTIRHYPPSSGTLGYSLQIGDPNIIAEQTGITTVADFRRRDIAAGGQGAPLVPAFHQYAFGSSQQERIILNLGGIANISHLPTNGNITGYDTGPANSLMDSWCQKHQHQAFDRDGIWALSGSIHQPLLDQLMSHSYMTQAPPKSTGREMFNLPWLEQRISIVDPAINPKDVQATLLQFTIQSVCRHIKQQDSSHAAEIYVCGGGAHNKGLINQLAAELTPRPLLTTAALGIHPDWVEAAAFAWLAKQTLEHRSGNVPTVTGAKKSVVLGGIYLA